MRTRYQMILVVLLLLASNLGVQQAWAGRAATIEQNSRDALQILYDSSPGAKALSSRP